MLEAYESPELSGIPSQFIDKDHMYTGTKVITTGIMVNTDKAKEQPAAFADLTKPAMKDEVSMPSPLYSGAAAYNLSLLTRTNGLGWDWYNALKANGVKVDKGNGSVQKAVVSGEKAYGIVADFMANRSRKDGAPVTFIYPSEGSPAVTEPIGLVKNAKHKKAAQAFIDFVLSRKGQELAASIGYTPIKEGVAAPEGLKSITDIHVLSGDVTTLFTNREADKNSSAASSHKGGLPLLSSKIQRPIVRLVFYSLLCFVFVAPVLRLCVMSFHGADGYSLANFITLFHDQRTWEAIKIH